MALADWLLPLLLLATDEHGAEPFDWASLDPIPVPRPDSIRSASPDQV
jgi:hypothetical protein